MHSFPRGLTLIEMLIGMAITLVMMAAVVNLFANISQGVRNRRATMEVSANLRTARAQLYNDLAGATCLKYPKNTHGVMPKPDSNNMPDGYFEIVEGRWSDDNPSRLLDGNGTPNDLTNPELDRATSLIPSTGRPFNNDGEPLDPNVVTDGLGLGDYDDILAMTVESQTDRFRGRGRGLRPGGDPSNNGTLAQNFEDGDWVDMAITSPVAEVVWFATENPIDRSEGEPGMRKIYRRVVLVAPWYGTETKMIAGSPVTGSDPLLDLTDSTRFPDFASRMKYLRDFQNRYDISVRLENQRLVPNTLADLARREFRFAHMTNPAGYPGTLANPSPGFFPYQFPYSTDQGFPPAPGYRRPGDDNCSLYPLGSANQPIDDTAENRAGEDLILSEVLAFDVQVFDPGAPLYEYQGSIVQPSGTTGSGFLNAISSGTGVITGFGTYVDLGWNNGVGNNPEYVPPAGAPQTLFQQERRIGWHPRRPNTDTVFRGPPAVYDTWTTYYETDTVDQDNTDNDLVPATGYGLLTGADEGTNGLDDPDPSTSGDPLLLEPSDIALNGPDDPLERETSPPYPYPLYGVQVKLRLYEPESRQIRETTVTRNLAK